MVTKEQIKTGLMKFLEEEVIPVIEDKNLQIILALGSEVLKANDSFLDNILKNQMVTALFPYSEGKWDTKGFKLLINTLEKFGGLRVTVPAIPFISPTEKELKFTVNDIKKIESLISQQEQAK